MRTLVLVLLASALVSSAYGKVHPSPNWEPTYDMQMSTVFMPCNDSGYFDPTYAAKWGVADFDWSNAKQLWANDKPMGCEERLIDQAKAVKMVNNRTRVFVYRNLVKALPWYTSVREKITDPAYSGWFLKFKDYEGPSSNHSYNVPACTYEKCSGFYHDQEQTPEYPHGDGSCTEECDCGEDLPCGEYLWDHRNDTLREWFIQDFVLGPTGLGSQYVDGFYFDDWWVNKTHPAPRPGAYSCDGDQFGGPSEEHVNCTVDMGLDQQDVTDIYEAWQATMAAVFEAVIDNGGLPWQYMNRIAAPTEAGNKCNKAMKSYCSPGGAPAQGPSIFQYTMGPKNVSDLLQPEVDIAHFLLARGPHSWLGYNWAGCTSGSQGPGAGGHPYAIPDGINADYGEPTGVCSEQSSGVWVREWSKATVQLDCGTLEPTITMKA